MISLSAGLDNAVSHHPVRLEYSFSGYKINVLMHLISLMLRCDTEYRVYLGSIRINQVYIGVATDQHFLDKTFVIDIKLHSNLLILLGVNHILHNHMIS